MPLHKKTMYNVKQALDVNIPKVNIVKTIEFNYV